MTLSALTAGAGNADRIRDMMIPMRDGIRLHARLYLPDEGEPPYPVVLVRSPYAIPEDELPWDAQRLVDNGYALVVQTSRGRFRSEGESPAFLADGNGIHPDGYDTVEWIARQPWCNGKIGTWGMSGPGITQLLLATTAPPHLACQHVGIATGDLIHDGIFQGGAYRRYMLDNWLESNGYDLEAHRRLYGGKQLDEEFWRPTNLLAYKGRITAPVLLWGGWYDCFAQGILDAFVHLRKISPPGIAARHRLIMGPWPHGIAREHGDAVFPEEALLPPHIDALEWFDHYLRGRPWEEEIPPVIYWVMAAQGEPDAPGNEWRTASEWPIPSRSVSLFLGPDGRLEADPSGDNGSRSFVYDPLDPVPTVGGCNLYLDKGCYDQRPVEDRSDVLLFTSPPLAEPMEITGRLRARLWVRSSVEDTDFTAKLTDVYPDGRSLLIQDGIVRIGRLPLEKRKPARGDGSIEVDIDLWSTSLILNRGHRLRLAVSSSNFPRFDVNTNTGAVFSDGVKPRTANNTVFWGTDRPSRVLLPVVGPGPVFENGKD